jgi:hypothetical protein
MHTLRVVRETVGWTIELAPGVTSCFRTRVQALREAKCLCDEFHKRGEAAEVVIEDAAPATRPLAGGQGSAVRLDELLRSLRPRGVEGKRWWGGMLWSGAAADGPSLPLGCSSKG